MTSLFSVNVDYYSLDFYTRMPTVTILQAATKAKIMVRYVLYCVHVTSPTNALILDNTIFVDQARIGVTTANASLI